MSARKEPLLLDVVLGTTKVSYKVQALFSYGTKPGETPRKKWSTTNGSAMTLEDAKLIVAEYSADGYEARVVKITVTMELAE